MTRGIGADAAGAGPQQPGRRRILTWSLSAISAGAFVAMLVDATSGRSGYEVYVIGGGLAAVTWVFALVALMVALPEIAWVVGGTVAAIGVPICVLVAGVALGSGNGGSGALLPLGLAAGLAVTLWVAVRTRRPRQ